MLGLYEPSLARLARKNMSPEWYLGVKMVSLDYILGNPLALPLSHFFLGLYLSCKTGLSKGVDWVSCLLLILGGLSVFPAKWVERYWEMELGKGSSEFLFIKCWVWGGG